MFHRTRAQAFQLLALLILASFVLTPSHTIAADATPQATPPGLAKAAAHRPGDRVTTPLGTGVVQAVGANGDEVILGDATTCWGDLMAHGVLTGLPPRGPSQAEGQWRNPASCGTKARSSSKHVTMKDHPLAPVETQSPTAYEEDSDVRAAQVNPAISQSWQYGAKIPGLNHYSGAVYVNFNGESGNSLNVGFDTFQYSYVGGQVYNQTMSMAGLGFFQIGVGQTGPNVGEADQVPSPQFVAQYKTFGTQPGWTSFIGDDELVPVNMNGWNGLMVQTVAAGGDDYVTGWDSNDGGGSWNLHPLWYRIQGFPNQTWFTTLNASTEQGNLGSGIRPSMLPIFYYGPFSGLNRGDCICLEAHPVGGTSSANGAIGSVCPPIVRVITTNFWLDTWNPQGGQNCPTGQMW